jgi:hypothetical protein
MGYEWMPIPEVPSRAIELVLSSPDYEHLIISDYFVSEESPELSGKKYMFIAKYRRHFEEVETFYEIQFNKLFLSLAECQEFAERFIESRPITDES